MDILFATSDTDILACYPVMRELRPRIAKDEFLIRVRRQQQSGYRLAFARETGEAVAVAGFRIGENLAWGRFLYVDDLVTLASHRSQGHGATLVAWLQDYAREHDCAQLHLDSGLQRIQAHRFYKREGISASGYHFFVDLAYPKQTIGIATPPSAPDHQFT